MNDIKLRNSIDDPDPDNRGDARQFEPDPGDAQRAAEITQTNEDIQRAHGDDPTPEANETPLDDASDPTHSVDEHMSAGSESPEDKVADIINSGILRI
jgi:hypothetical protein